ncbi:hypothetical protein C8Q74DRAFT_1319292 [Fomes fomentarius]|nr:hypothetical protein C8Q74DRAFT_1319292 [Fomes fomentarius]
MVYAFYKPIPEIREEAKGCGKKVKQWLHMKDVILWHHAESCWGTETISIVKVHNKIVDSIMETGTITAHITHKKDQNFYMHHQHTRVEVRMKIVQWVWSSLGTIPSPATILQDMKMVFVHSWSCITKVLQMSGTGMQEYKGKLVFVTNVWTSPNHCAFVAVTVHFKHHGNLISLLLDLVKVVKLHTGTNLVGLLWAF